MAKSFEVLVMLCPGVEWTSYGEEYKDIVWHSGKPAITEKQFKDGFAKYDAWKSEQDATRAAAKAALLAKLGITEDEAQLLLS